jgi:hypothetical protein
MPSKPVHRRLRTTDLAPVRESAGVSEPEKAFPPGFFERTDRADDGAFYDQPRLVTHIDEGAIAAVGSLYEELELGGDVLDLMGSWVSHFREAPARLTVLGMNAFELQQNPQAHDRVVHDLNEDPRLPFEAQSFDGGVCCTFSNRCFPTKAIRGWLYSSDAAHCEIVSLYFVLSGRWEVPVAERRSTPPGGDPLFAVWSTRSEDESPR